VYFFIGTSLKSIIISVNDKDREKILYRILAGKERVILIDNGVKRPFWIKAPTITDKLISCDIYDEAYSEAVLNGLYTEEEAIAFLEERLTWRSADKKDLQTAIDNIDKLKIGLYKSLRKRDKEAARLGLAKTRELISTLSAKKFQLSHRTAEHFASTAKIKYLIGRSLFNERNKRVWKHNKFWLDQSELLDNAYYAHLVNKITETQIRELSRTDPWRPIWICKSVEHSMFGISASNLSEDQKSLVAWSRLYDSCYEDQERPPDSVIEEDDMFDGWLIVKRKEREKDVKKSKFEDAIQNEKIANSSEVFVMAAAPGAADPGFTDEELEEIEDMNSPVALSIKRQRMNVVKELGEVKEADMPDTKQFIQSELNKMRANAKK